MSVSEYITVCLSARTSPESHVPSSPIFVHVTRSPGLVLLWRRYDALFRPISSFVDGVMFDHNGLY